MCDCIGCPWVLQAELSGHYQLHFIGTSNVRALPLGEAGRTNWSKCSACAALWRCRQNRGFIKSIGSYNRALPPYNWLFHHVTSIFRHITTLFCHITTLFHHLTVLFRHITAILRHITALFHQITVLFHHITALWENLRGGVFFVFYEKSAKNYLT